MAIWNRRELVTRVGAGAGVLGVASLSGCALDQQLRNRVQGGGAGSAQSAAGNAAAAGLNTPGTPEYAARQQLLARFPQGLLKDDYVARTEFDSVWAIRNTTKTLPRYFGADMKWYINVPEPYGFMETREQPLGKAGFDAMRKGLAAQIDTKPWHLVKGKGRPVLVVYSAWDCPHSRNMEAALRRAGISYYLVPSGLEEKSTALARRIYATPEFDRQWQELLTKGSISGKLGVQAQPYPEDRATDLIFIFKTVSGIPSPAPSTPLFIFKDGRSGEGWRAESMLPLIRKANQYF